MARASRKRTFPAPNAETMPQELQESVSNETRNLETEVVPDAELVAPEEGPLVGRSKTGMPIPPGHRLLPETLFQFLKRLNDTDWAHCDVYINDKYPIVHREPAYIAKLNRPFGMDYFQNVLGSGIYIIRVNDTELPTDHRTICTCKFDYWDDAYPPKRNLEDVSLNHPKNADYVAYLKRQGLLNSRGEVMQQGQDGAVTAKLADALIERTRPAAAAESPMIKLLFDQMAAMRQENQALLARLLTPAPPPPAAPPADSSMKEMVLLLQKQNHELVMAQLNARSNAAAGGSGFGINEYMKLEERIEAKVLARTKAAEPAEPVNPWVAVAEQGLPILQTFAGAVAEHMKKPAAAPADPAAPFVPGLIPPTIEGVIEMPQQPQQPQNQDPRFAACLAMMRKNGQHLLDAIDRKQGGDDAAETIEKKWGAGALDMIVGYGRINLYTALLSVPEFAARLAGREKELQTFIEDFVGYTEDEPSEADTSAAAVGTDAGSAAE